MRAALVGALLLTAVATPTIAQPMRQPPAAPPLSSLPEGRLQLFAGNARAANFLALDQIDRKQGKIDLWFLNVPPEPYALNGGVRVAETLIHGALDCGKRTYGQISSEGFDTEGKRVVWLPSEPAAPLEANTTQDFIAKVLCDGAVLPPTNTVVGHKAAIEMTKRVLAKPAS
jgi:hypothetical protein